MTNDELFKLAGGLATLNDDQAAELLAVVIEDVRQRIGAPATAAAVSALLTQAAAA